MGGGRVREVSGPDMNIYPENLLTSLAEPITAGRENAGEMSCPADLQEHRSQGLWLDLGKVDWEMTGSLGHMGGRELGDLSNTATTDRV